MVDMMSSPVTETAADTDKSDVALSVSGVSAGYETTAVLRDVSLDVAKGSVTALIGPNGAGKTSLMKAVAGLLPVALGRVELFGADVTRAQQYRRALAGLLLVDQYVHRVLDLADHAYVPPWGRIVYSGTSESLQSDDVFGHFIGE